MTYAEAKAKYEALIAACDASSAALQAFPKGPAGLTPDAVKAMLAWRAAHARFDLDFAAQRNFAGYFVKAFAKERKAERAARLSAPSAK